MLNVINLIVVILNVLAPLLLLHLGLLQKCLLKTINFFSNLLQDISHRRPTISRGCYKSSKIFSWVIHIFQPFFSQSTLLKQLSKHFHCTLICILMILSSNFAFWWDLEWKNRICIRHLDRKMIVLSCHRCLINSGVEKMNYI